MAPLDDGMPPVAPPERHALSLEAGQVIRKDISDYL
jgi:hypothetical protein